MSQDQTGQQERRSSIRAATAVAVRLSIEVDGYDDAMKPFFATGETINLSRSGMLARVDRPVPLNARCEVLFSDAGDAVAPQEAAGKVVRSEQGATGCRLAIEFDQPLLRLDPDDSLDDD